MPKKTRETAGEGVLATASESKNSGPVTPRKTESLKRRSFFVYVPDELMADDWKNAAKESRLSISRFVVEHVENSLRQNGEGSRFSRKDLIDQNAKLTEEIQTLREDLDMKTRAYGALNQELVHLRNQAYVNPTAMGVRQVSRDLVRLFLTERSVRYDALLPSLGIIATDTETVRGINAQIEALVQWGLLLPDRTGWRWIGDE